MNDEEINAKIAEACGWTRVNMDESDSGYYPGQGMPGLCMIPDYCNDLHAMYEAEEFILDDLQRWMMYTRFLRLASAENGTPMFHFTAKQRAEAFLKTP